MNRFLLLLCGIVMIAATASVVDATVPASPLQSVDGVRIDYALSGEQGDEYLIFTNSNRYPVAVDYRVSGTTSGVVLLVAGESKRSDVICTTTDGVEITVRQLRTTTPYRKARFRR